MNNQIRKRANKEKAKVGKTKTNKLMLHKTVESHK